VPKIDSLRFSPEVSYLVNFLRTQLRKMNCKTILDDIVNSKILGKFSLLILGLVFGLLEKIWKKCDLYIFAYVKEVKTLQLV